MLPSPETEPLLSVGEAAGYLGISRTATYRAVKAGDIPSLKLNGRLYVPTAKLRQLVHLDDEEETVPLR